MKYSGPNSQFIQSTQKDAVVDGINIAPKDKNQIKRGTDAYFCFFLSVYLATNWSPDTNEDENNNGIYNAECFLPFCSKNPL